VISDRTKWL